MRTWIFWTATVALLFAGLWVRLAVINSPAGQLDADEAVVGLMARRIAFGGERPVFFYGQAYLGTLEAFTAAVLFWMLDSSSTLLKLVPSAYSLAFLGMSAAVARRLFGAGPALVTMAYLACPPAMWALWSTKARGGYAEMLFLGESLVLVTLWLVDHRGAAWGSLVWGLIAGLALWTHPLAVVFVVASGLYLWAMRGRAWSGRELWLGAGGLALGAAPLLSVNLTEGFPTVAQLLEGTDVEPDRWLDTMCFGQLSLPVLAGAVPPSTLEPGAAGCGPPVGPPTRVAVIVVAAVGAVLWLHTASVRHVLQRGPLRQCGPALLVALAVLAIGTIIAAPSVNSTFAEPRYGLPLYAAVPLVAAAVWRLPWLFRVTASGALLALNAASLVSLLTGARPVDGNVDTTAENRAALIQWLTVRDRHQIHTDYWIAFPVMFESRERVLAEVVSSGPNRYIPYADNVAHTPNAAWVFLRDSDPDVRFRARVASAGGVARAEDVSVYRVYLDLDREAVFDLGDARR